MTQSSSPGTPHVYFREIKQGERTSLSVVADLIAPHASVLDLGCGSGALGQHLHARGQHAVDGVTFNEAEATHARPHYRRVQVADLETSDLPRLFPDARYDAIVCADVLEHLRQPERILAACRRLLAPAGRLLLSIPNAGYCGLVAELLMGEFRYREEGLLDRTHLRFFTRASLQRFLAEQGWAVAGMQAIERALPQSEFRAPFDALPPAVARYLLAAPDAQTYQFIAIAHPHAAPAPAIAATAPMPTVPPAQALFTLQLFHGAHGGFAEHDKTEAAGIIGVERQTISLPLRAIAHAGATWDALRLDPADRSGFLHLHRIALCDAHGTAAWEWRAEHDGTAALQAQPHQQISFAPPLPGAAAGLLLLYGDDPWLQLPIPADLLGKCARAGGHRIVTELGWPMSADYLALANQVLPLDRRIHDLEDKLAMERDAQQALADTLTGQLAAMAAKADMLAAKADMLAHDGAALADQNRILLEQRQTLTREKRALDHETLRLRGDVERLATHLRFIENSTIFRATRPLVKAKMRLDRLLGRGAPAPACATPMRQNHPMPMPAEPVDIIVPVYRGLEDTRRCIASVLASRCATPWRLIVINDASPEPEVTEWLRQCRDPRLVLLENADNLGFVGTVNRGMASSETHDVLLLNSDTEVANDWLDRLRRAAYGDERVATVTPFSTNATICSYPRFCHDNALPDGYDTARLDALFAATNAGQAIDIPTGVGFCMYIRRDSLRRLGLFDMETFGKGYGEENDFCRRAAAAGWRNLHALDTFVLHTGGVSFGSSKSQREQDAMETLRRLYPDYETEVLKFVQDDPARPYRQLADLARLQARQVPIVLAVAHNRGGGTLRHVEELAAHLHEQAAFLLLTPAPGQSLLLRTVGPQEAFELAFQLPGEWDDLVAALRGIGVAHIHFHHLIGHDERIRQLPALLDVQYDFTAHDFYTFCPQISLTDHTHGYCGERGLEQCRACLRRTPAPGGASIEAWRETHAGFVTGARHVLAPSRDTARRFASFVPAADIRLAPHTDVVTPDALPAPRRARLAEAAPLRIVVIGALSAIKGADVLEQVAIAAARRGAPVEFHLLGYAYRSLRTQPRAALTVHGAYRDEDLPGLLQWLRPDAAWFPAQWPETYSYTLSACLQAGLPIVAPDIGAFAERLAGRPWTWVRPWHQEAAAWLEFFETIRTENFMRGTSPAPASGPAPTPADALVRPWSYAHLYLDAIHSSTFGTAPSPPCTRDFLNAHRAIANGASQAADSAAGLRTGMLRALSRLRAAPVLRTVARRIPRHWQRRVKDWLLA